MRTGAAAVLATAQGMFFVPAVLDARRMRDEAGANWAVATPDVATVSAATELPAVT